MARVLEQACARQDGCVLDVCLRGRLRSIADSVAAGERFRRRVAQGERPPCRVLARKVHKDSC